MEEEIDLRPYIRALIQYWWLIAGSALLGAILAFFFTANRPPVYQASALVTVLEPTDVLQFDARVVNSTTRNALLKVLPELAKSDQVIRILAERLDEAGIPAEGQLPQKLIAEAGRDPILLNLRATHPDPQTAAEIVNTWAEVFVALGNEIYTNQGESRLKFYEDQFASASERLDAANEALAEFQGQNPLPMITNELTALTLTHAAIISHTAALQILRDDIQAARVQQAVLSGNPLNQTDQFTALALQARALNLQETLPFVFQSTTEAVAENNRDDQLGFLDSLEAMVNEMENASIERLAGMAPQILAMQKNFEQLNAQSSRLIVDRDLALETYSTLTRKLDEERIAVQDTSSGFKVASRATAPNSKEGLSPIFAAVVGALVGILLSSLIVIVVTWWQSKTISS